MKRVKPPVKYRGMSMSVLLVEAVKKHIQDKPEYRSVADFVNAATRERLLYEKNTIHDNYHLINENIGSGKTAFLTNAIQPIMKEYIVEIVKKEMKVMSKQILKELEKTIKTVVKNSKKEDK